MSADRPISMKLLGDVLWRRGDEPSVEHCRLMSFPDGFMIDGRLLTVLAGAPAEVFFAVHCGHGWHTRSANVELAQGVSARRVQIRVDDAGHWWLDDQRIPGLDGVIDVDLSFTPATNTLPIRRLALAVGESASTDAAWLRFPELSLERLRQRYTRVSEREYRYESGDGAFAADLEVDGEGVVVRYGDLWHRVSM